jgi:hypothetical protein
VEQAEGTGKTVWIQNNHHGDIKVVARVPDEANPVMFRTYERIFQRYKTDQITGRMEHSGYTEIPAEEFDIFCLHSSLFKRFLADKKLTRYDEAPLGASSPAEQVARLTAELAALRKELEETKRELAEAKASRGGGKRKDAA